MPRIVGTSPPRARVPGYGRVVATVTVMHRQRSVREFASRLLRSLTLARLTGQRLVTHNNRFEIVKMLGRGASGVVCQAQDLKLGRAIAMKLYPGLFDDQLVNSVRNEARSLAGLNHRYIVTVYDFDAVALRPGELRCFYVAMELLDGESMRRWLARGQTRATIVDMFCRAGEGLAAAHRQGYVHRDFKPENVMVVGSEPKIVDFGLATDAVVPGRLSTTDPHERTLVGTLAYMAPEALAGQTGKKSDQFAFAAALWEALYDEFPYPIDKLDPRARGRIRPPTDSAGLPAALLVILRRALDRDPSRRFPTMEELVQKLRSLPPLTVAPAAAEEPERVAPVSVDEFAATVAAPRAPAPRRRRRVRRLLGAGALAALGALAVEFAPRLAAELEGLWPRATTPSAAASPGSANVASITSDPAVLEPQRPVANPCAKEQAIAGAWSFRTHARWAARAGWHDRKGRYTLAVVPKKTGCTLELTLTKPGDDRRNQYREPMVARASTTLQPVAHLASRIAVELEPRRARTSEIDFTYAFEFVFADDRLYGAFETRDGDGAVIFGGPLVGRRGDADAGELDFGEQPCAVHCAIRCLGPEAVDACRRACAADPWSGDAARCGAPDLAVTVAPPQPSADPPCATARALAGTWTALAPDPAAPGRPHEYRFVARADGCALSVDSVTRREPGAKRYRAHASVLGKHAWRVTLTARDVEVSWQLLGRGPAFGSFRATPRGRPPVTGPIAAYREP